MDLPVTHLDLETRSRADLLKVGAPRYAEDPSTEILCGSYQVSGGPLQHGTRIQGIVRAHNALFERSVLNAKTPGLNLRPEQMDCTLARACAVGLPASLEQLGKVLKVPVQKDKEGHRLMLKMCRPKKIHADGRIEWHEDPAELARLADYCDRDVESECAVDGVLPQLSLRERAVWTLDQHVNDRGFAVDLPKVRAALDAVGEARRRADRRIWELTNGAVSACTQTKKIVEWIRSRGIPCESIAKGEVPELVIRADLFDEPLVEEVITLRRATTRMFRFDKILAWACRDGRVRGAFQYHKAHTGRWAAWTQSFPRVDDPEAVSDVLDAVARWGAAKAVDYLECAHDAPLRLLSQCLRPMVVAPPGKKLIGGDFSNIEGRVAAWFARMKWKLEAFKAYDEGTGPDLYLVMAASILNIEVGEVSRLHRQSHGKVPELAAQFQGAVAAFQKMAHTQDPPVKVTNQEARRIVNLWRDKNDAIVDCWKELQDAAITAVEHRGLVVPVLGDRVRYVFDGKWLYCRLPSGRALHYASPSVRWKTHTITTDDGDEIEFNSLGVTYYGVDGGAWRPIDLYGGMQFNHIVQGFSRDLLVEAMFAVEDAGYPIVMHTHDDIICEIGASFGVPDAFSDLMRVAAERLAPGLPVSVKAWEGPRWL
jgi:DNA polymerase